MGYSLWGHKRVKHDLATKQQQNKQNKSSLNIKADISDPKGHSLQIHI